MCISILLIHLYGQGDLTLESRLKRLRISPLYYIPEKKGGIFPSSPNWAIYKVIIFRKQKAPVISQAPESILEKYL
jgi:hypothetical protein